jgi:thiosulfate/3-mercaptopyruvate sulfurtransferase
MDTDKGRTAYFEAHIPGAQYAHLDDDLSGPVIPGKTGRHPLPDPARMGLRLSAWGIGPVTQVVAYDDVGGGIAARLWWMVRWLGLETVAVLDGGWPAWVAEDLPTESGATARRAPRTFVPELHPDRVVTADEVDARRGQPGFRLLDARAAERYRGEQEPIDPVAGHIPGALSAPFKQNLDADGRFLPPEALHARFEALLQDTPPGESVSYCGSGVTAAHNLLAMAHAGLGDGRLYAGSWSDWITDPYRPVSSGEGG